MPLIHHCHCPRYPNGLFDVLVSLQVLSLRDSEEIGQPTVTKWSGDAEMMRMFQLFCLNSATVKTLAVIGISVCLRHELYL